MAKIRVVNPGNRNFNDYDISSSGQISFARLEENLRANGDIRPSEVIVGFEIDNEFISFQCARKKKRP